MRLRALSSGWILGAMNPGWEYRLWTDENLPQLANQLQFDLMPHLPGTADILR
jgi:hypothetical protein